MPTQIAQMDMDQPVELIQPTQEEQQGSSSEAAMDVEEVVSVEAASVSVSAEEQAPPRPAAAGGESTKGKQDTAGQESLAQGVWCARVGKSLSETKQCTQTERERVLK